MSTKAATVVLAVLVTTLVWWVYAMAGGFAGLYEDIFDCPRESRCEAGP